MTQEQAVAVTPKVDTSYHNGEDVEKAVASTAPLKFDEDQSHATKKFLCWRLKKRQWIYALVGSIVVVLAVVLLILFLAIVPAIFQKQVDKVELTVNHLDLLKMSGDRSSNEITSELSIHVVSDAMAAATMYETTATLTYQGKAFGKVTIPETKLKKGKYEFDIVIRGQTEIVDQTAFREVSKAVVEEETLEVGATAKVKIHALGLSYGGLDLKRTIKIKGLNQFSDPISEITHITVTECTETEYKMATNITLNNDSDIGLDGIGVLNMTVYADQEYLGQAISTDAPLGIPRGSVPKQFMLTVERQTEPLAALAALLKALVANKAQFYITGNNPYAVTQAILLDEALTKLNMSVPYTKGLDTNYMTLNTSAACTDLFALITGRR